MTIDNEWYKKMYDEIINKNAMEYSEVNIHKAFFRNNLFK